MADQPQKSALRWLAGLAVVTGLSVIGAVTAVLTQQSATEVRFEPKPFFDDLETGINKAERIVYTIGKGLSGESKITLKRKEGEGWVLDQRFDFPAKPELVRKLIVGLVELEAFEPRTANPEWHRPLGLTAPEDLGRAVRIEVLDGEGERLAALLAGEVVEDTQDAQGRGLLYARKDGDDQAWLARGRLPLLKNVSEWLDLKVFELPREEVKRTVLWVESEEPVIIARESAEETNFTLTNAPEGRTGRGTAIVNGSATALVGLVPEDVIPDTNLSFDEGPLAFTETFSGLRLNVRMTGSADVLWAKIYAEADPALVPEGGDLDVVRARADAINARTRGWAFRLDQPTAVKLAQSMQAITRPSDADGLKTGK